MQIIKIFKRWLPFAVVVSAFSALGYTVGQQILRQSLNDPQIQMAEDAAYALDHGAAPGSIPTAPPVEMSRSLAPFLVVFDLSGKPIAGTGMLNGQLPTYPKGALDSATQSGENRVTWQPASDVRIASVVVPYQNGFVMAGRNMREGEQREGEIQNLAGVTWILGLIATLIVIVLGEAFPSRASKT